MKNYFVPIDGADTIGASSYYLEVDNNKILFDCGSRNSGLEKYPRFDVLYEYMNTPKEIDMVVLSHAHFDHIGALPYVSDMTSESTVFLSTKTTRKLSELQLLGMDRTCIRREAERIKKVKRIKAEKALDKIREIPIMEKQKFKNLDITLIPAGHMPGASMTYVETANHKVLYTGDFSFESMNDINKIRIDSLKPDILIMNATSAYKQYSFRKDYAALINQINFNIRCGKNVLVLSKCIPKHLDLFYLLNGSGINCDVYLSEKSELIANSLEEIGYSVYSDKIKGYKKNRNQPHVLFGEADKEKSYEYEVINGDLYSLHASYEDLERTIDILNPKKVFIVHSEPNCIGNNIVSDMKKKNIDIVQCQNEIMYEF